MADKKETWEMSLEEYAECVYGDPTQNLLYKENIKADLKQYEQTLHNLLANMIKPSSVVGTGYKNPRNAAIAWLSECINEYQAIVDGTKIHSVIRANYEYQIRKAIREGTIENMW